MKFKVNLKYVHRCQSLLKRNVFICNRFYWTDDYEQKGHYRRILQRACSNCTRPLDVNQVRVENGQLWDERDFGDYDSVDNDFSTYIKSLKHQCKKNTFLNSLDL